MQQQQQQDEAFEERPLLAPTEDLDPHVGAYGSVNLAAGLKPLTSDDVARIEAQDSSPLNVLAWFFYDGSESFWMTTLNNLGFSPYALLLGLQRGWSYTQVMMMLLLLVSAFNLLIALFSPFLGALTDVLGFRKWLVVALLAGAIGASAAMPAVEDFYYATVFFGVAWVCMNLCRLLYDSQIPFVLSSRRRGIVQSIGGALSVIGACLSIVSSLVLKKIFGSWKTVSSDTPFFTSSSSSSSEGDIYGALPYYLWAGAGGLAIIAFPYLFHKEKTTRRRDAFGTAVRRAGVELRVTMTDIFKDRNGVCFTVAWMIIISSASCNQSFSAASVQGAVGVNAVITDVSTAIGLPSTFIGALACGFIMHRYGGRVALLWAHVFFMLGETSTVLAGWHIGGKVLPWWFIFFSSFFVGSGVGIMLTSGRQIICELAAPSRVAQWNGFQKICGRIGLIVAPCCTAVIFFMCTRYNVSINMAYRFTMFFRLLVYAIGFGFCYWIVDPHPRYMAGERAPFEGLYEPGGRYPRHIVYK